MGKSRRFLSIFASLFIAFFSGSVSAAGYSCPAYKKYTECNENYFMSGGQVAGNSCEPCGTHSTSVGGISSYCTCDEGYSSDGTASGSTTVSGSACLLITVSCSATTYLPKGSTQCAACPAGSYCAGGEFSFNANLDQGINSCPDGYTSDTGMAAAESSCYITVDAGKYLSVVNTTTMESCAAGTYKAEHKVNYGSVSTCDVCSSGQYSDAGAASCLACDTANGYTNVGDLASDHAGIASCMATCAVGEYVAAPNTACTTVGVGYWKESHTVSQGGTSTRNQCPAEYQDGAAAGAEADCIGTFEKVGQQENAPVPENCASVTEWGTCEPSNCEYKKKYSGEITEDCTPTDCTKPVLSVTANAGYYDGGTTCPACSSVDDGSYTMSAAGNEGGSNQCYKDCSVACTQQACPENANCTYGDEVSTGTQYFGNVCSAVAEPCSMSFTCNSGYKKTESGDACEPIDYTITYENGGGVGDDDSQGVKYNEKFTTRSADLFKRPGYTFISWGGDYPNAGTEYTYTTIGNTTLTAQWEACLNNPGAAGTCDCQSTEYPNGSGCEACVKSCATVSGFSLGSYDVCDGQTDGICYRECLTSDIANSTSVEGSITKDGVNSCVATSCSTGYTPSSDGRTCELIEYSITLKKNGGTGTINGSTGELDATQTCQHGVMCNLPSSGIERQNYEFTGWGESQDCVSGVFKKTFTGPTVMYACWSQQTTQCQPGKYYDGSERVDCPVGMFCSGEGFANIGSAGCGTQCPDGGSSDLGSSSQNQCYITCSDKDITGGKLAAVSDKSNYDGSSYPACTYTANCNAGYVASANGTAGATCTQCGDGVSCPGGTDESEPKPCSVGSYCEAGIEKSCPVGGTSVAGADAITDCYKVCTPTINIDNGQGISTGDAFYSGSSYPECQYTAQCNENYTPQNSPSTNPSCVWGNADECPEGHYCPPDAPSPVACPDGGTSEKGSKSITQCYKIFDEYEGFQNGVASTKCFYQNSTSMYDACSIIEVKSCIAGYWYAQQNALLCSGTTTGYYSPDGQITQTACPKDQSGGEVKSNEYAESYTDCYKACEIEVPNSTSVVAKQDTVYGISADAYATCSFAVTCETGYTVAGNNTEQPVCMANEYTITLDKNGGSGSVVDSLICTFDSGTCELPAVDGLSRQGYTVQPKWCSDEYGNAPCYYAGQSTATNISADGTDLTLYAVWTPNVYEITLDHQSAEVAGVPETVYLKYATGWFTSEEATSSITKLTKIPTKAGYSFMGYYSETTGGTLVISSSGEFQTSESALTITYAPTTIYARWTADLIYCEPGEYYSGNGNVCLPCTENNYCPGGNFATDSGIQEGMNACPDQLMSDPGSEDITSCYKTCEAYDVINGTAIPVSDKAFYPNECVFEGQSETGNPCEIIDGVCVEKTCNPGFEMQDGTCVPCDRENALSYKEGGVCLIAECVLGYHPNGDRCETNVKECSAPNAVYAEKIWDSAKNAFGSCMIKECESGYHVASNACVSDVQPCNVENGTGFKEWNHDLNKWGECVATLCNPGYTNDPSETNELSKQCGECKNKYSVLGKLAASSYVQGCEIASCMYQGELYNLEYNECVPICPTEEYEDETGTMVWDEGRKKCVRTCKEGYTMW